MRTQTDTGEYTFLFTDIEGSTQLWEQHPIAMRNCLARHDALLRVAAEANDGVVFKTIGDAFCIAFSDPAHAVRAAIAAQRALGDADWGEVGVIRVRMAIHGGEAERRDDDFFGPALNRVARLRDAGHGGQMLVSATVRGALNGASLRALPEGIAFLDRGEHRLKDLATPERIYQLAAPGLTRDFPPLRTLSQHPNNLPAETTSFVGRDAEVRSVRTLVENPTARLITLTGFGGSGKTRLALEVAEDVLPHFPQGVWFVDLSAVSEPALVAPAIARVCGLGEDPTQTPLQQLGAHFREARALLLLDNFEHVEEAADDVAVLLRACARLQVLVTSRTLLNLSMEHEYVVPPLHPAESLSLFAARARQVEPAFALTGDNRHDVEAICVQLDGIPLAVELAAAQVRFQTPPEIARSLDQRLQVLSTRMRDLPPRHRSLRGAIDGSYELLSEPERELFRALSVFVGGFTVEAVESVCGAICRRGGGALTLLSDLRDKSLIRRERDGQKRFVLLESLRQYGAERLEIEEPDSFAALRDRHADFYRHFAEQESARLNGADQVAALDALEADAANLRAAMRGRLEAHNTGEAARLGVALRRFWQLRRRVREGRELLERAAASAETIADLKLRSQLLFATGTLWRVSGAPDRAVPYYSECLRLSESFGDLHTAGQALNGLGGVAYHRGELDAAEAYFRRVEALERDRGNTGGVARSLNNLGLVAMARGAYEPAEQLFRESLALREQMGDRISQAQLWNHRGAIAQALGRLDEARGAYEKAFALSDQVGNAAGRAYALINRGHLAVREAHRSEAERCYAEALEILRPADDRFGIAECVLGQGTAAARLGGPDDLVAATRLCGEGLRLYHENHDRKGIACALESLAEVSARRGRLEDAAVFLAVADVLRRETGACLTPYDAECLARVSDHVRARRDALGRVPTLSEALSRAATLERDNGE